MFATRPSNPNGTTLAFHVRFADWRYYRREIAKSLATDAPAPMVPYLQDKWFRTREEAAAFAARLRAGWYLDDVAEHLKHPGREDAFAVSVSTEFIHPDDLDLFVDEDADDAERGE